MSDRIHSLTVIFKKDMDEENAEKIANGISCFFNVLRVDKNITDTGEMYIAKARANNELIEKILELLKTIHQ